jgi:hypothetical protein
MINLDESLRRLLKAGRITRTVAQHYASESSGLK